jgi:hypothetical protein
LSKEDKKTTDYERVEALLYRIITKLNAIEIGVDDAAHGYYKEKKRTSGLTSKIKKLQEELGIEPLEPKYPRVNKLNWAPGQSISSRFGPEEPSRELLEHVEEMVEPDKEPES